MSDYKVLDYVAKGVVGGTFAALAIGIVFFYVKAWMLVWPFAAFLTVVLCFAASVKYLADHEDRLKRIAAKKKRELEADAYV